MDCQKHQAVYDHLVRFTGCTSATDTLKCLRAAPYATIKDDVDKTPSFLSPSGVDYTWGVSFDEDLVRKIPRRYILEGCYAGVPMLGGQVDDEGT